MEVNLNCDLGEKSRFYNGINDPALMQIINTANIACGYHAGNKEVIDSTVKLAKKNDVSIGAHPGFKDKKNFGRKRIYLEKKELQKIILAQLITIDKIAKKNKWPITHVKPHGALNNMACEDFDIANTIGETIKKFRKDLIYLVLPFSKMEKSAQKLNLNYACEIFADRNYQDDGNLLPRSNINSLITNANIASKNILEMLDGSSIHCLSGKKIKCNIDSICVHSDSQNSLEITKELIKKIKKNGINLVSLDKLKRFS